MAPPSKNPPPASSLKTFPPPFKGSFSRAEYRITPSLATACPTHQRQPIPQAWGVDKDPRRNLGHPTCPPAAILVDNDVMTNATYRLKKYYTYYECPLD